MARKARRVVNLRWDNTGTLWISRTDGTHAPYNPAMPVSSLAYVLTDRFDKDITDIVFELREKI